VEHRADLGYTTATADLTSIGGPAGQTVTDGIVQEIDIRTGKVLFRWNSGGLLVRRRCAARTAQAGLAGDGRGAVRPVLASA
jgi:Arylsulfotransferase (ASST)